MASPKAIQTFQSLGADRQKRFLLFVQSPYFNTREKLWQLTDYIRHRTEEEEDWDATGASIFIFGDAQQQKPLTNLLSDLNRLLEQFLSTEALLDHEDLRETALARGMTALSAPRVTQAYLRRKQRLGVQDPLSLHHLNRLADQFHFQQTRQHSNEDLLESQKQLTLFYLTRQLKTWCELLNRRHVLDLPFDPEQLNLFRQILESASDLIDTHATSGMYRAIFIWLSNQESDAWYDRLQADLLDMLAATDADEIREVCAYLQNYFVRRINEGKKRFLQELYNLFQYMLAHDLVLEGQTISQWTYKNIVTVGLRLQYFDTTESFIHEWYSRLPEQDRDNAYYYNLAALHYESRQYDKARKLLQRVHFTDPVYYLDSHCILLKIYWEEGEDEAIRSLHETVRIYLLRQRSLNKQQIQLYRQLFRFTLRLFRLRYTSAHLSATEQQRIYRKIRTDLDLQEEVANRGWLQDQWKLTGGFLKITPSDNEPTEEVE
ncbi:MAG: hypothetical protein H6548_08820 [Chitinophagales bacterium]|nr:hypothetical protein [Chitinophagales bacterium]HAE34577.1 hypothetical protein [Bacteroidota bacterium]MCB9022208.1 hypothetical protein [Chitinophagales bacterium]HQU38881.1 hypothetical protein [Chitinophagales bacterium]HQU75785.1 hypothetical protein [Chitinophagales bacterium]